MVFPRNQTLTTSLWPFLRSISNNTLKKNAKEWLSWLVLIISRGLADKESCRSFDCNHDLIVSFSCTTPQSRGWLEKSLDYNSDWIKHGPFMYLKVWKKWHYKGGERNMKQRILISSITSKLALKSMYASGSTGPFFADHYSHRSEQTHLKFRQENQLPVKISCIIWNEMCKKKKLINNRNGIFCQ